MSLLTPSPPPFLHAFDRSRYAAGWLAIERDEEDIVQPLVLGALRALGGWTRSWTQAQLRSEAERVVR